MTDQELPKGEWFSTKERPEWMDQKQWILLDFGEDHDYRRYHATRCPRCESHRFSKFRPVRWMVIA